MAEEQEHRTSSPVWCVGHQHPPCLEGFIMGGGILPSAETETCQQLSGGVVRSRSICGDALLSSGRLVSDTV